MITRKVLARFILGLAILSVANIVSFAKDSVTLTISLPASVGGVQVAAGEYQVSWVSHSPEATVEFAKKGKVIATAEGKLVNRDVKYPRHMVVYRTNADGSYTITEIRLRGKRQAIVFNE
jgi:hypothetical protein